jgi:hypothetical protein
MKTKQIMLMVLFVGALSITSCSNSNDDESLMDDCQTCTTLLLLTSEHCDNGDGTVTINTSGQETTIDLQGVTFEAYIIGVELAVSGTTCK